MKVQHAVLFIAMFAYIGCEPTHSTKLKDTEPQDCLSVLQNQTPHGNGIYRVQNPDGGIKLLYCDMTTAGGGWTVFQKRYDGSMSFYKTFEEYEYGFGDFNAEFWMGLKHIHEMTSHHTTELRIDLTAANGTKLYTTYPNFSLSPGPDYTLHLGLGVGNGGDALGFSVNLRFKTTDKVNCYELPGGWWYRDCGYHNLNREYVTPAQSSLKSGILILNDSRDAYIPFKNTRMMFRRKLSSSIFA